MINEGEVILLILATGVLIWALINRKKIATIPHSAYLKSGFYILYVAFACTVFEALFWDTTLNIIEHICYALSMFFVLLWTCKMFGSDES
ncbi:MAG: hypothetical protein JW938_02530 [Candidatus Omnitrophica bacterium]|nr:hypothetical protein [Candidatus Omnitrophota bacterium]